MASTYIILVNWNGYNDTIECMESLLRLDQSDFHIIVVDNGSIDGSIERFKEWSLDDSTDKTLGSALIWNELPPLPNYKKTMRVVGSNDLPDSNFRISVIDTSHNLGFAGANNVGIVLATRDHECQWLWILNNDTVVSQRSLSSLIRHCEFKNTQAIVGAVLLYYDTPNVIQGVGGWFKPNLAKSGHIYSGEQVADLYLLPDISNDIAYVMGASMFVRRDALNAIGYMSEDYFLYYEELDWASRLPIGLTQGVCLEALVYHKEGSSIGTSSTAFRPGDTSLYYLRRSALRFYWRHQRLYLPVAVARIACNAILCLFRRDFAAVKVTIKAFSDAILGRSRRGRFNSAEFHAR